MKVEASLGDVVDRVTILLLKAARIADPGKHANIQEELRGLRMAWAAAGLADLESLGSWERLCEVNGALWDVEDQLREHERNRDFGPLFVERARSVYRLNDERAALKRQINEELGSAIVEEKSYAAYR
jgi:hypothetical protein